MAINRRRLLASSAACASLAFSIGRADAQALTEDARAESLLQPTAMREDLAALKQAWLAIHPGLFRYLTPASLDAGFEAAHVWADQARTLREFFLQLAGLTALVRCGHTYPNPANQGRLISAALLDRPYCVPFAFRWIGRRMIVTAAMSQLNLIAGDEVTALDGISCAEIFDDILPLMRADGGNDAKRVALMEVLPGESQSLFDLYRSLMGAAASVVRFEARGKGGQTAELVTLGARRAALAQPDSGSDGWRFSIEQGIGHLVMPTWALYNSSFDWLRFIDSSFDALIEADARGLILDVRGNEGGLDEVGRKLLSRLMEASIEPPRYRRLVRYRNLPEGLNARLDTWDEGFRDWGDRVVGPDAAGYYELHGGAGEEGSILPSGRTYRGRVVLLIDAANSSATFDFARMIKAVRRAELMGTTTGGSLRGINGGAYFFARLPNSRVEIDLPLIGYFPLTPQPDAGVEPDIGVRLRQRDIARGFDRTLAAARARLGAAVGGALSP